MGDNTNIDIALRLADNANAEVQRLKSKISKLKVQKDLDAKQITILEKKNTNLTTMLEKISTLINTNTNSNLLLHNDHVDDVDKIFRNREFMKLLLYTKFDIEKIFDNVNKNTILIHEKYSAIMKHIIDNCEDLNRTITRPSCAATRLIHLICYFARSDVIQYAINNKSIDLEYCDKNGHRPIHLICFNASVEDLGCIINRGVNIDFDLISFIFNKSARYDKYDKIEFVRTLNLSKYLF